MIFTPSTPAHPHTLSQPKVESKVATALSADADKGGEDDEDEDGGEEGAAKDAAEVAARKGAVREAEEAEEEDIKQWCADRRGRVRFSRFEQRAVTFEICHQVRAASLRP